MLVGEAFRPPSRLPRRNTRVHRAGADVRSEAGAVAAMVAGAGAELAHILVEVQAAGTVAADNRGVVVPGAGQGEAHWAKDPVEGKYR